MATLKEIQAKQAELSAGGKKVSLLEAKSALGGTTHTTTPAPVAPKLTEQEVRQSMSGLSVPERQQMRSDLKPVTEPNKTVVTPIAERTPEPEVKAPEPVTPPTTPVTPPPVTPEVKTEIKHTPIPKAPETPKVEPIVDRTAEINKNLEEGYKNTPSLFANYDTYKKAYGYDTKPVTEQQQLDAFFTSKIPQDTNTMYSSLKSGVTLPESVKNTKAYTQANAKYNTFAKYNTMTPEQLFSAMVSNDIGTELGNELSQNPNYAQAKAKYDAYIKTKFNNDTATGAINAITGVKNTVENPLDKLNESIQKFMDTNKLASYRDYIAKEDPKLVEDVQSLNRKTQLLQELVDERDDMTRTVIKDNPGLSKGAAMALSARLNEPLNDQIRTMTYENNALIADVKYRQDILDKSYTFEEKQYQDALNFAQQSALAQYQSEQGLQNQMIMSDYQAQQALKTDQAKFEQGLAQQAQLAKDPVTGVKSILATYAQMGITPMRSEAQIIADIEKQVAQGVPVEQALTDLNKAFQSKPEYKQYMDYKKAQMTPTADKTPYQLANLGDGKAIMYNQSTGAYNVISSSGQPVTTQEIPSIVEQCRTTGSCGQGVNDYLQKLGDDRVFGNTYSDKQKKINSTTPAVGSIAVWQPTGKMAQPEYGHVGIVTAVNGDQVTVTDWNWNGDNKQSTHTVPLSSILANNGGFYVPKTGTNTTPVTNKSSLPLYRSYVEEGKLPSKDALKGLGLTSEQFSQQADAGYNEYLKSKADEISKEYPTLNIEYTGNYAQNSATQKEKLNESIAKIGDIDNRLQQLKDIFNKVGTEVLPTTEKAKMNALRQQIILKAKEIENLGVLNGPDLGILESLLPATTGFMSGMFSFDDNTLTTINQLQSNYRTDAKTKAINYGARLQFTENDVDTIKNEFNSFN